MVSQLLHVYYHCLFHFMQSCIYKKKVSCLWYCKFYRHHLFINSSVCLLTCVYEGLQNNYLSKPSLSYFHDHFLCQTIDVMAKSFRGCFCLQGVRVAIQSQPLAKSRLNPSTRQIPSYT
jgi:hypothetical protein